MANSFIFYYEDDDKITVKDKKLEKFPFYGSGVCVEMEHHRL